MRSEDGDDHHYYCFRAEAVLSALVITYWANFVKEGSVLFFIRIFSELFLKLSFTFVLL